MWPSGGTSKNARSHHHARPARDVAGVACGTPIERSQACPICRLGTVVAREEVACMRRRDVGAELGRALGDDGAVIDGSKI